MRLLRFYLLDNPIFHRELRRKAIRRSLWRSPLLGGALVLAISALAWIYVAIFGPWDWARDYFLNLVAIVALAFASAMAVVWPATGVAASVARERQQRTLEGLAASPLTVGQVLTGKAAAVLLPAALGIVPVLFSAALAARLRLDVRTMSLDVGNVLIQPSAGYWLAWSAGLGAVAMLSASIGAFTGAGHPSAPVASAVALLLLGLFVWLVWELHHSVIEYHLSRRGWLTARAVVDALLPWLAYLLNAAAYFAGARWRLARLMRGEGD